MSSDRKSLINLKKEQSMLLEKAEQFRQLLLSSSLKQERILKFDGTLDSLIYNISVAYENKIDEYEKVGNI